MRQFVILSTQPGGADGLAPLGSRASILEAMARMNTAPERDGADRLHGPGIELELMPGEDPVRQMLLSINDEDIAWTVILRIVRQMRWKLSDLESGRELVIGGR